MSPPEHTTPPPSNPNMASNTALDAKKAGRRVEAFAAVQFRNAFPNLEQSVLESITREAVTKACDQIVQQ